MLLFLAAAITQITPDPPLAKGTGLPPSLSADADAPAVLAAVQRFLDAIAARDAGAIVARTRPEGGATSVTEQAGAPPALRHQSWAAFAGGVAAGSAGAIERLVDPAVEVDGAIAMVWSPYVVTVDGRARQCGSDHFDLLREQGDWKILNATWTQRMTGCEAR